jgi:homoserine O-acetyltransferase
MGIHSDTLYPPYQQHQIRDALAERGVRAEYAPIDSPHGHDSFLIDTDQVGAALAAFLETVEK